LKPIRRPLAALTAAVFALTTPLAYSNSVVVTNCNDSGSGSLRNAISVANTTDTVDMTGLKTTDAGCSASTITLKTGAIAVLQNDLIIAGPGVDALTVTGQYIPASGPPSVEHDRIFTHTGTGRLILTNFSISHGYVYTSSYASGGCIYSTGSVQLFASNVTDCTAASIGNFAFGGALYTRGQSSINYSSISGNHALALTKQASQGGAIWSGAGFSMRYSTVAGNSALCALDSTTGGSVGGIFVAQGSTYIQSSTIANNSACDSIGGLITFDMSTSNVIINSTIANNKAEGAWVGGADLNALSISISNSTVAFNGAANTTFGLSPGLALNAATVMLDSNLISNNVYGADIPHDISITGGVANGPAVSGTRNLIFSPAATLPSDTIVGSCPLLGTLRDNGGTTSTIAPQSHSPAIDAGVNEFGTSLPYDQRGMPFARTVGAAPDIGAYEINQADIVFTANFEGCP
jgi:hypothetical protein